MDFDFSSFGDLGDSSSLDLGPVNDAGAYSLPSDFSQYLDAFAPTAGDYSQYVQEQQALDPQGQGALSQAVSQDQMGPNQTADKLPQGMDKYAAPSTMDKLMRGLGLQDKSGNFDISNPKTLDAVMKSILGGSAALNALLGGTKAKNYTSATDLQASLKGPYDKFNPQQQAWASNYFNNPSAPRTQVSSASMPTSVVKGYAEGGPVDGPQGALSLIQGSGGGQDDIVDIKAAPGEFMFDADTVAAVGDGSNERGAQLLNQWRQNLRQFKRAADPNDIPPQTGDLNRFMPHGALSMGDPHGRN